jgi:hypothetical protein
MYWRVLGDEGDAIERRRRTRSESPENPERPDRGRDQPNNGVQQRCLAGSVRANQSNNVP